MGMAQTKGTARGAADDGGGTNDGCGETDVSPVQSIESRLQLYAMC